MAKLHAFKISTLLIATLACFSTTVLGQEPEAMAKPVPTSVVIAGSQWYGHFPAWVGIERGFFSRNGFNAIWEPVADSTNRIAKVAEGDVQFSSVGEYALLKAMADREDRIEWVGTQDVSPGFEGIVARAPLASIGDLRGKCIGYPVDSSAELTLRMLLEKHDLDPATGVMLDPLTSDQVAEKFRSSLFSEESQSARLDEVSQSGQVAEKSQCEKLDAAIIWDPDFSRLAREQGVNVLGTDLDTPIYAEFKMMTGPDVLVLNKKWRKDNPDQAEAFLRTYFSIVDHIKRGLQKEDVYAVHGSYVVDQPVTVLIETLERIHWLGTADQSSAMSTDGFFRHMDAMIEYLIERKLLDARPDYRKWIPEQFLNIVIQPDYQ